ncbi:hypothetical protein NOVO_00485 [Rickettsiales bacterium Ac37b]|nr:hypothetical protein NOVO_00485 [Rickettsiales bacterium Ac37b]
MKKSLAVVALSALISLASNVVFADDTTPACSEINGVVSLNGATDGSCVDTKGVVHTFKDNKEVEASN